MRGLARGNARNVYNVPLAHTSRRRAYGVPGLHPVVPPVLSIQGGAVVAALDDRMRAMTPDWEIELNNHIEIFKHPDLEWEEYVPFLVAKRMIEQYIKGNNMEPNQPTFTEREQKEIYLAIFYSTHLGHGAAGHTQYLLIAKLAALANIWIDEHAIYCGDQQLLHVVNPPATD